MQLNLYVAIQAENGEKKRQEILKSVNTLDHFIAEMALKYEFSLNSDVNDALNTIRSFAETVEDADVKRPKSAMLETLYIIHASKDAHDFLSKLKKAIPTLNNFLGAVTGKFDISLAPHISKAISVVNGLMIHINRAAINESDEGYF